MSETISESTKLHIQEMLLYPQISEKVYSDTIRGKTYKLFEIEDDGVGFDKINYESLTHLLNFF